MEIPIEMQNRTLKRVALASLLAGTLALSWGDARHRAFAQDKVHKVSPRDANGKLQPFDCTLASPGKFLPEPGAKRRTCDPSAFARLLKSARTVAVTLGNTPLDEDAERERIRRHAEGLIRRWGRLQVVRDPEVADLVFQFHQPMVPAAEPLPWSIVYVWPQGADPGKDDLVWLEIYVAKWAQGDSVAGVLRLLRRDIEDAEKLQTK